VSSEQFKYHQGVLNVPLLLVFSCWVVYYIEIKFGFNFNKWGIRPGEIYGLRGVFFGPFIHGSFRHLFNNSFPLLVMSGVLFYFYRTISWKVLITGTFLTGVLTWMIARPAYHIGASGVVYFLVSFIFFSGVFRKYYRLAAVSLITVFLYGSMVWYIFPMEERISWEGHLSGFITGLVMAFVFRKVGPKPEIFEFHRNEEFESYFDEEGNFNPPEPASESDEKPSETSH